MKAITLSDQVYETIETDGIYRQSISIMPQKV